jgi:outer membrane immunogenic protein
MANNLGVVMKSLLLAVLSASTILCGAASAADMPVMAPADVTVAGYDWSGAYIGIHGGYAWGETDGDDPVDGDLEGFVIGGQVGYNWMLGDSFLIGLEGDGSFSDQNVTDGGEYDVDYLATIRGRLGFAFDRFLVYGTGGAAFAGAEFTGDDIDFFGWAAGGGVEYAITDNISFGVEYLHYDFGEEEFEVGGGGLFADNDLTTDVVRGRLNVKFDSIFGQ